MIKQIKLDNLYNFKDVVFFDFTVSKNNENLLTNNFSKEAISNFALVYGKNNVGKSNFIQIINDFKHLIETGGSRFSAHKPSINKSSTFEIIVENENYEVRYGIEFAAEQFTVHDEWMHAKIKHSTRETMIFERKDRNFYRLFNASHRRTLEDIKPEKSIINFLKSIDHNIQPISMFHENIENISILTCLRSEQEIMEKGIFHNYIINIAKNEKNLQLMRSLLSTVDLDIEDVVIAVYDENEIEQFEQLQDIYAKLYEEETKTGVKSNETLAELTELAKKIPIHKFLAKPIYGTKENNKNKNVFSIDFVHKSKHIFNYDELSTGTKQLFNIGLLLLSNLNNNHTLFIDEIETGLHPDVVDALMIFMATIANEFRNNQFIITTHSEKLLDLEFISNEAKIFLKREDSTVAVDYLSNYKLREYQTISKRYLLDAFESNPSIDLEFKNNIRSYKNSLRDAQE